MRVAWLGNLGNVGFQYVRLLAAGGIDAELHFDRSRLDAMYPGNPEVEYPGASREVFVRCHPPDIANHLLNRLGLPGVVRSHERVIGRTCDIVQAQSCLEVSALRISRTYGRPFLAMATGADLSEVAQQRTPFARLYRRAVRAAHHLFLVNTNQYALVQRSLGPGVPHTFLPLCIDFDRIQWYPCPTQTRLVFLSISRLDWTSKRRASTKGNDVFLRGFARFMGAHTGRDCELRICDWGTDRAATRQLVADLGISEWVRWVAPGDKAHFQSELRQCHVAVDQFNLGAIGLGALEAMAAGRAVMARCETTDVRRAYGVDVPVFNCADENAVSTCLAALTPALVAEKAKEAAAWVATHHGRDRLFAQLQAGYASALGGSGGP